MAEATTDLFDDSYWDIIEPSGHARGQIKPAGLKLELKTYDVRDNSKGDKVILQTGKKSEFPQKYDKDHESALVVTKTYNKDNDLTRTEIVVRSPHILAALKKVIVWYPGLNLNSEQVTLSGPPRCLFHYHKDLANYGRSLQDKTSREHLLFALNYMKTVFAPDLPHFQHCMANQDPGPGLDFDRLWMAYRPGDLIFLKSNGKNMVGRLVEMYLGGFFARYWTLKLERIVCSGPKPMYNTFSFTISSYSGFKHFQNLDAFPLKYISNLDSRRQAIVKRGEDFFDLVGVHQRFYRGNARWAADPPAGKEDEYYDQPFHKFQVKSRVMVDPTSFIEARPDHEIDSTYEESKAGAKVSPDKRCEENFLICHNEVYGYSLTDKRWCAFDIHFFEKIDFSPNAFNGLLLPSHQKKTILSLVEVHTNENLKFDDLVKDKGKGMIFLLHGAPGVGKTLTAESIADYVARPLFIMRSGDLGNDAKTLEKSLNEAFELSGKWNAIILIDEADVFLEARRHNELVRNSLVSVFLRVLEYYEGIMFLTTNRINAFDPAFRSRIHLSIKYQPLSRDFRRQLWYNFINSGMEDHRDLSVLEGYFLDELAGHSLNGRQIRNVVRTAYALAVSDGEKLRGEHIQTTLKAMSLFDDESDFDEASGDEDGLMAFSRLPKRRRLD